MKKSLPFLWSVGSWLQSETFLSNSVDMMKNLQEAPVNYLHKVKHTYLAKLIALIFGTIYKIFTSEAKYKALTLLNHLINSDVGMTLKFLLFCLFLWFPSYLVTCNVERSDEVRMYLWNHWFSKIPPKKFDRFLLWKFIQTRYAIHSPE